MDMQMHSNTEHVFSPEKDLPAFAEQVGLISNNLWNEVETLLIEGIPHTSEGLSSLLTDRFSVSHDSIYELGIEKVLFFFYSCSDETFDKYSETIKTLRAVVDRMHVVCTLRDDLVELIRCTHADGCLGSQYLILDQLAQQNSNLSYTISCLRNETNTLFRDETANNLDSHFGDLED